MCLTFLPTCKAVLTTGHTPSAGAVRPASSRRCAQGEWLVLASCPPAFSPSTEVLTLSPKIILLRSLLPEFSWPPLRSLCPVLCPWARQGPKTPVCLRSHATQGLGLWLRRPELCPVCPQPGHPRGPQLWPQTKQPFPVSGGQGGSLQFCVSLGGVGMPGAKVRRRGLNLPALVTGSPVFCVPLLRHLQQPPVSAPQPGPPSLRVGYPFPVRLGQHPEPRASCPVS